MNEDKKQFTQEPLSKETYDYIRRIYVNDIARLIYLYPKSMIYLVLGLILIAFILILDIEVSSQIGAVWFEPVDGESTSDIFGKYLLVAVVLITLIFLHMAKDKFKNHKLIEVFNRLSITFSFLILASIAILYGATLTGSIQFNGGDFGDQSSHWLGTFLDNHYRPYAQLLFSITFGLILFISVFALSGAFDLVKKSGRDFMEIRRIKKQVIPAYTSLKIRLPEFIQSAKDYNTRSMSPISTRLDECSLLVYERISTINHMLTGELESLTLNQNFEQASFGLPEENILSDDTRNKLELLSKALQAYDLKKIKEDISVISNNFEA